MRTRELSAGFALFVGVLCTTGSASAETHAKVVSHESASVIDTSRELRRSGHEQEALTELRKARGSDPRIDWEIARTQIAKRDFQGALATCKGMERAAAASSHACAAEAHLLWRRGSEASTELAEVAKAKDGNAETQYSAKVSEGRIAELASKDAEAEAAFREAIKLQPARDDAYVRLGALLRRQGKDASEPLKKAVEVDAKDPLAQLELGRALPIGSTDSVSALEKAVAQRPGWADAMRSLADGYVAAKRLPDAKKQAEAILKLAPNDAGTHVIVGRVALAEGHVDEALKEGNAAAAILANEPGAKLLVADAQAKKGEIDFAIEAYQAAFGLDHADASPLLHATDACIRAGRLTSAKAFARRAIQEFPTLPAAEIALGDAMAADGEKASARASYEAAKKLPNADAAAIDTKLAAVK